MPLPTNLAAYSEVLLKLPQQKIAKVISALLLCYIAYLSAQLTWLFIPQKLNKPLAVLQHSSSTNQNAERLDLTALEKLNLFGIYNDQSPVTEVKVQDAPETRLRLTLSGTVASDDASIAAAIIENNGKQETYGIGDKITGTRAILESVATDRVLIKQSGKLETLMLDGFKYHKSSKPHTVKQKTSTNRIQSTRNNSPQIVDQRNNRTLSQSAMRLKNDINDNPSKITDYLKIVPKRRAGKIIGYQLLPGKKPEFFRSSGLKSGDIAVQMNGLDLTMPSEAAQALQALKTEQELSLLIERNGEMTEILFSIQ